jgi:hypothetical protein
MRKLDVFRPWPHAKSSVKINPMTEIPNIPEHSHRPHDMGGDEAGPIDTNDAGMKFWQKQANALRSLMTRNGHTCTDELRRSAEDLGEDYNRLAYFEKTTTALRNLSLEKGYFTADELAAKMEEVRARFDVPDEMTSPIKKGGGT